MGLFMDMLNTGNRKRAAREEYEREHPRSYQDDYSSGSSRPRRIKYEAYCRICGATSSDCGAPGVSESPGNAIDALQEGHIKTTVRNNCGRGNHSPAIREIEV